MTGGVVVFIFIITLFYSLLILRFIRGWNSISPYCLKSEMPDIKVSLIIPFRNEGKILEKSFSCIDNQNYPESLLEVIYVNDHSGDNSAEIVKSCIESHDNFMLINCDVGNYGKKAALREGAYTAGGDLLLFTDADCFPDPDWVKTMAGFYKEKKPVMISGPLFIITGRGIFNRAQSLELMSLTASGAGSFGTGDPVMCSGANLGFDRKVYLDSFNNINSEIPSGDDMFMMIFLKKAFPGKLEFIKSRTAVVYTEAVNGFVPFFLQRMRWASKSKYYNDVSILFTASIVLMVNVILLFLPVLGFYNAFFFALYGVVFFIKAVTDIALLFKVSIFFQKRYILWLFIPVQLLYPLYVVISGLVGLITKPAWKGRK